MPAATELSIASQYLPTRENMKLSPKNLGMSVVVLMAIFCFGGVANAEKPNIILINLDDANQELFSESNLATRFPHLNELAQRSIQFTNAHATTPLCGPSRACLLRAQYAHHCGIKVNEPNLPNAFGFAGGMRTYIERGYAENDLSTWMQDAGYHTIQIGKFLHSDNVFVVPEGWDDFYSSNGARYFETFRVTNRNGFPESEVTPPGLYRTNVEAADAVELIHRRADSSEDKPFFMYLNSLGPHLQQAGSGEMYEARYADLWPDAELPKTDAYDEAYMNDRVGPFRSLPQLNQTHHDYFANHYRERLLAMKSVDNMVGDVIATLRSRGLEDNTYVFVTSDNGFALGEHRFFAKSVHVEAATSIPLLVAGPGIEKATSEHLLAHIDIGPTIVQLAGGSVPDFVDGVSFTSLIDNPDGDAGVRESVLIENFQTRAMSGETRQFSSTGLRLKNSSYVEWADGGREYFDFTSDPLQLKNVYGATPLVERQLLAAWLRSSKARAPSSASFHRPYYDLDELEAPFVLEGIAEATISTRVVKLSIRDLSSGKFWNGNEWSDDFAQVQPPLSQPNGMLTTWRYPLNFGDEAPAGLMKAWVWGIDWGNQFDSPDTVVFRLGETKSKVTLTSPIYAQTFAATAQLVGDAIGGGDIALDRVRLRIRNVTTNSFWDGTEFKSGLQEVPVEQEGEVWSYRAELPAGTYRASVAGIDEEGNSFQETHRLFFVAP